MGILDLLQGAVSAGTQAKGAYVNRSNADAGSLIQMLRQQKLDALAERRQNAMDEQNAAILPLRTRLMKSQIDNYESLASHRGEPHPAGEVHWDKVQAEDGSVWERNPITHETRQLTDPKGNPIKAYHPKPSPTAGLRLKDTPQGTTVIDLKSATSRPVSEPGATVSATGGKGQLQPRAAGNQKLQALAIDNRNQMSLIDEALREVQTNPSALGLKNMAGDLIAQRLDPKGVKTRTAVSDIGSLKIHERTGAAMSKSELARLGFIPTVTDTPEAAMTKLRHLRAFAEQETQALEAAGAVVPKTSAPKGYSPDNPFARP
jgi:hypothetical protein